MRLASKLGFSGFAEMKESIQEELSLRLAPASDRVGARPPADLSGRVAAADSENVIRSLEVGGAFARPGGRQCSPTSDARSTSCRAPAAGRSGWHWSTSSRSSVTG